MTHVFRSKAPLIRLTVGIGALLVVFSIGGFIDLLATEPVAVIADLLHGPMLVAEQK